MTTKTLQEQLEARTRADQRAANAVIDVRGKNVRIIFGNVGEHGRIVLNVEGDKVSIAGKPQEAEGAEGGAAADGVDGAAGIRRAVDMGAGEYVDDRDPLKPGENPLDAVARIEADGLSPRQAEAVADIAAVATTTISNVGIGAPAAPPSGASEIKNPVDDGATDEGGAAKGAGEIEPADYRLDELREIAKRESVPLAASDNTKAEIAAAINKARAAK